MAIEKWKAMAIEKWKVITIEKLKAVVIEKYFIRKRKNGPNHQLSNSLKQGFKRINSRNK